MDIRPLWFTLLSKNAITIHDDIRITVLSVDMFPKKYEKDFNYDFTKC